MPEPWEPETGNESWSDRDAWRGDTDAGEDDAWRSDVDAEWGSADAEEEAATDDTLLEDWPENLAGPEYWLYKRYGM